MSLQNILKTNDYDLYCDELNANTLTVDSVNINTLKVGTLDNLDGSSNIIAGSDIVTISDDAQSLGAPAKGFRNLYCGNLFGLNGPVNVRYGITGSNGTSPLYVIQNGLIFDNSSIVPPITSYTMNRYIEYSGQFTITGAVSTSHINYSAVVVGKLVTMSLQNFSAQCVFPGIPITIALLPNILRPTSDKIVSAPVCVDNTQDPEAPGALVIRSDSGNINMYPNGRANSGWINGQMAGFYLPSNSGADPLYSYTFSYNLN